MIRSTGFEIGLEGTFDEGKMIEAKPIQIDGYSCRGNGPILEPMIGKSIGESIYTRDVSTSERLTLQPLLKDPLEDVFVEVQKSTIVSAGEGLFLKKDVKVFLISFNLVLIFYLIFE